MTFFRSGVEQMAKLCVKDSSDAKGECTHITATILPQLFLAAVVVRSQPSTGCRSINR